MAKRHFLQLAHPLNLKKHAIGGWMMSEKYDGCRAFWDGGISRGLFCDEVPYANVEKDARLVNRPVATGLWSRYGKVIHAPGWFLDQLPPMLLDGELTAGRGKFQLTTSIIKQHNPTSEWRAITFVVLDSPRPDIVFEDGLIQETNFKKRLTLCHEWSQKRHPIVGKAIPASRYAMFETLYKWLHENIDRAANVLVAPQEQLPFMNAKAEARLDEFLEEILQKGGEGVILRKNTSTWMPERTHNCLKYKPFNDAEAKVTGYIWGRRTELGSKLLGLMGALVVEFNGKRFELSGFTDAERKMTFLPAPGRPLDKCDPIEGERWPGHEITDDWYNPKFPVGSVVTFKYRELTNDGLPKEGRFFRKRDD